MKKKIDPAPAPLSTKGPGIREEARRLTAALAGRGDRPKPLREQIAGEFKRSKFFRKADKP
jgi:hypothetical protein